MSAKRRGAASASSPEPSALDVNPVADKVAEVVAEGKRGDRRDQRVGSRGTDEGKRLRRVSPRRRRRVAKHRRKFPELQTTRRHRRLAQCHEAPGAYPPAGWSTWGRSETGPYPIGISFFHFGAFNHQ